MSLPFGAGIGRYAEDMGTYCENIQHWLDVAECDLRERDLLERRDAILGLTNIFGSAVYDTNDMDSQLAVLALAMATGTRFEFPDGKLANGWISYMVRSHSDSFELDLHEYLTPMELLSLGSLHLL